MPSSPHTQTPEAPLQRGESTPTRDAGVLLVAMPALNEAQSIDRVIRAVPDQIQGVGSVRVLVVDDGSTDATADIARQAGAEVLRHAVRRGVGGAFQSAARWAMEQDVDYLVTIDADGQFDPADIPSLVAPVANDEADFVTASRFVDPSMTPEMPAAKRWGNRVMSRIVSLIARRRFYDVSCGMRCYSRRALLNLHLMGEFTYTQEVFLNLAFKGLRITEVPVAVRGQREHGHSRVARNLFRYAWQAMKIIVRCYRDYHPMRFFGRLALVLMLPGILLLLFLVGYYAIEGRFTPHKWAGVLGIGLVLLGLMSLHIGAIGDMLNRQRTYLEEILYRQRVAENSKRKR